MSKFINLIRLNSKKLNLLKLDLKILESSYFYSTKQAQNIKSSLNEQEEPKLIEGQIKEDNKRKKDDDFEFNLFLNDLEAANLTEEERKKYLDFLNERFDKRAWILTKTFTKEVYKLIRDELFMWYYIKDDKIVNDGDLDIKWKFKEKKDIKGWLITCDSMQNKGHSTCFLNVNKQGRLVFHGYLDSDNLPNDGITTHTGFAHLSSPFQKTGFGLECYHNWSQFNHLVIRFRGDGRVYRILLKPHSLNGMQTESYYEYFLYTRGGPYWQIAKIPFSKFLLCCGGRIQEKTHPLPTANIQSLAFTLSKYTGPYRLEISHIGLQLDTKNYQEFDYETYFIPGFR